MGKSQAPKWSKLRKKCKCGRFYYPTSENKHSGCTVCYPIITRK